LDGIQLLGKTDTGRNIKRWILSDSRELSLYKATHINHPSAVWCRQSKQNYQWLYTLLVELCNEYTYRYEKTHKCELIGLVEALKRVPTCITKDGFTEPTPAMPEQYKVPNDSILSYKNYYNGEKQRMFSWKKRQQPDWINNGN
jgi:hypothetical protein